MNEFHPPTQPPNFRQLGAPFTARAARLRSLRWAPALELQASAGRWALRARGRVLANASLSAWLGSASRTGGGAVEGGRLGLGGGVGCGRALGCWAFDWFGVGFEALVLRGPKSPELSRAARVLSARMTIPGIHSASLSLFLQEGVSEKVYLKWVPLFVE